MAMQARLDIDTTDFTISERPALREDDAVLLQDAGRSTVLAPFTLMGKIAATGKWNTFTDETDVTGLAGYFGIYMGPEIAAATIVAGDVVDLPIVYQGMTFDEDKLVIENSKTLATIVDVGTVPARSLRDAIAGQDLIAQQTRTATSFENS